jgi:hypothetical protein
MEMLSTVNAYCPYCGEPIELIVDGSQQEQTYIEDCQVCCRPIEVTATVTMAGEVELELRHENE